MLIPTLSVSYAVLQHLAPFTLPYTEDERCRKTKVVTVSAAILVHAFVTSKVDYCNLLLVGAPKSVTDKLQRVMNAAARVVSSTKKYDRGLTHLLHSELHWLDVTWLIESHTSLG